MEDVYNRLIRAGYNCFTSIVSFLNGDEINNLEQIMQNMSTQELFTVALYENQGRPQRVSGEFFKRRLTQQERNTCCQLLDRREIKYKITQKLHSL